jgi:hypothetical protein
MKVKLEARSAEDKKMAPATAELMRMLHKERAWTRLEDAVKRVEREEQLSREFTRRLDEWRVEPSK